jgi:hypothetical protein
MTAYCNIGCQRADWALHKLDCKVYGKLRENSNAAQAERKAEGRPKADLALCSEWFEGVEGLSTKVECMAGAYTRSLLSST